MSVSQSLEVAGKGKTLVGISGYVILTNPRPHKLNVRFFEKMTHVDHA